jgi:hypothetical protein
LVAPAQRAASQVAVASVADGERAERSNAVASVSASDVFASVNDAAEVVQSELRAIASMAAGLQGDRWTVANLDVYRPGMRASGLDDAEIERRISVIRQNAEQRIVEGESFMAGAHERFGPAFSVTGSVVQRDSEGNWQMGDFSITSKGGGFALKLDRENGLMLKDAGGAWRQDSAGTAALRLLEDTLARPPRALDQTV